MFAFTSLIPIFLSNVSNFRQNERISRLLTGCWFCTTAVAGAAEKKVKAKFGLKYFRRKISGSLRRNCRYM